MISYSFYLIGTLAIVSAMCYYYIGQTNKKQNVAEGCRLEHTKITKAFSIGLSVGAFGLAGIVLYIICILSPYQLPIKKLLTGVGVIIGCFVVLPLWFCLEIFGKFYTITHEKIIRHRGSFPRSEIYFIHIATVAYSSRMRTVILTDTRGSRFRIPPPMSEMPILWEQLRTKLPRHITREAFGLYTQTCPQHHKTHS